MKNKLKVLFRAICAGVVLAGLSACAGVQAGKDSSKPNFIIIFIDDQGYQDLGCFGSPNIKTPNIDRMAAEGMRFTDFYSAASVCTPSRGALLTGRYPDRLEGVGRVLFPKDNMGLEQDETTIAKMLKASGYKTICIGKWHLGHKERYLPTSHGFDSYFGIPYSNDMSLDPESRFSADALLREGVTKDQIKDACKTRNRVPLMRNEEVIEYPADQNLLTKRYTGEAVKFIKENKKNPFFIYLPHTMPHIPLYASPEFEGKSEAGLYGDCIEEIDWSVGEILQALKETGIEKETLVIYTSDNGPWNLPDSDTCKVKGDRNRRVGGSALPLRGHKFSDWEGGMREPTVMYWPGRVPAGMVCSEVAGTIDILPTIAELSGSTLPGKPLDGKSIVVLLEGKEGARSPHEAYFYRKTGVRHGKWKFKDNKLFDLSADISEQKDVSAGNPEVVARLKELLKKHNESFQN